MTKEIKHTKEGIWSIYAGILGIITLFIINWIPFIFAIIAIYLGGKARQQGDNYGTFGMLLGLMVIILAIVLSALVYFYVTSLF